MASHLSVRPRLIWQAHFIINFTEAFVGQVP
jgi:hypothetical protein